MIRQSVGNDLPTDLTREPQWFRAVLLIVIAVCTYTHVPLVSGGRLLVPSFPTVALVPILLFTVRRSISVADVIFLFKVAFVLLLSIAFSPGYAYIGEKLLAMVQLLMALGVAVLIVRLMQQLTLVSLERVLLVMWCLILLGSVLEILDVIRVASDTFREWAYEETYGLYSSDLRDLSMVGWTRPKLFSEEPSHVTKFFIASINSWLLVRVTGGKAAVVAGATVAMLVIMGSPMLLASAGITLTILALNQRARLGARVVTVVIVLLIGALIGAYFAESTYSNAVSRVSSVSESSTEAVDKPSGDERRIVLPYVIFADTILRSPLFGAGIGGKEVIAKDRKMAANSSTLVVGNNAMAGIGIFLGLVGGALFVYLVLVQARQTGVRRVGLLVVILVLFSQLMGGIDTFRYWGFIALLWGALAAADLATNVSAHTAGR